MTVNQGMEEEESEREDLPPNPEEESVLQPLAFASIEREIQEEQQREGGASIEGTFPVVSPGGVTSTPSAPSVPAATAAVTSEPTPHPPQLQTALQRAVSWPIIKLCTAL